MLNGIFVFVVGVSILLAAHTGQMQALTDAILADARKAVELAIGLVGVMAFFLGLMRVAEDAGLLRRMARLVGPVMRRLFPGVPVDHPAMSAMILNISSNMLGLANAATPFGIRAMEELNKLNRTKGTATNAMVLFLAINTAGFAILPSTVIAMRASLGSRDAAGIFFTTWFASAAATLAGISAAILLSRLPRYRCSEPGPPTAADRGSAADAESAEAEVGDPSTNPPRGGTIGLALFWSVFSILLIRHIVVSSGESSAFELTRGVFSYWILPAIVGGIVLFGWSRGVKVYASLVEGAREGFQVAIRIIPYLVAILVAVGMLRASGGIDLVVSWVGPLTSLIGMPAEALPMALLRPLSGSGSLGVMAEIMTEHGPDSFIGYLVSTFQGSTETTFYVIAVYFGAVGVTRTRHALPACLIADASGIFAALLIVHLVFG